MVRVSPLGTWCGGLLNPRHGGRIYLDRSRRIVEVNARAREIATACCARAAEYDAQFARIVAKALPRDGRRGESQVAAALAEGSSVREIAETTFRAESTVRWLIKQTHSKLRISRLAELVRMVPAVR